MAIPTVYMINTAYLFTWTFVDVTGVNVNPSSVTIEQLAPDGTKSALSNANAGTGIYTVTWTPTMVGTYYLTAKTTGPAIHSPDQGFVVQNSFYP